MTAPQFETKRLLNTEAMKLKKIPTEELFDCKMQIFYKEGSSIINKIM